MPPRPDKEQLTLALSKLSERLEEWRSNSNGEVGRRRIPEPIWERATELAGQYGVGAVSVPLRLDHAKLKSKVDGGQHALKPSNPKLPAADFVEILGNPAAPQPLAPCVLHIESHRGSRVRLEVGGLDASGLATLLREFT